MPSKEKEGSLELNIDKTIHSLISEDTLSSYAQRIRNYIGFRQEYRLDKPITIPFTDTQKKTFTKINIFDLVKIVSESQIIEMHTPTQAYCLNSLVTCLSTYLNYAETLQTGFQDKEQEFINTYSLFRGAVLAKSQLREKCVVEYPDDAEKSEINLKNKPKDIIYDTTKALFNVLENAYHKYNGIQDDLLVKAFDLLYTQLINQCICMEPAYKEMLKKTGLDTSHQMKNVVFRGFKARDSRQEKLALPNVTLDMIAGNEEFIRLGKELAINVLAYSFDAPNGGKNPMGDFPQLMMSYGQPGTGKTITAYALLNYFAKTAKENNIPFLTKAIRKTDWTSSFQYASARNLVNLFNDLFDYDRVVGIYWPDFDTAFQARSSTEIRAEEKDNLNVIFGLLDGTLMPRNGKWFMILDANYMDPKNMDLATFSRLQELVVEVKGPEKPEQYIKLCRDVLLKDKKKFLSIKGESWEKFGKLCKEYELSGRAIEKISKQTAAYIGSFEKPKRFLKMSYEKKLKVIEERSRKVNFNWLLSTIENYVRFQKERDKEEAYKQSEKELQNLIGQLSKKS